MNHLLLLLYSGSYLASLLHTWLERCRFNSEVSLMKRHLHLSTSFSLSCWPKAQYSRLSLNFNAKVIIDLQVSFISTPRRSLCKVAHAMNLKHFASRLVTATVTLHNRIAFVTLWSSDSRAFLFHVHEIILRHFTSFAKWKGRAQCQMVTKFSTLVGNLV